MKYLFLLCWPVLLHAQPTPITAFPSLQLSSSSRGMAMGECGIASATENQALYFNAAKTAFTPNFHQLAFSYSPWMQAVSDGMRFISAEYLGSASNGRAWGAALHYLDMGTFTTRDNNGAALAIYKAREYNVTGYYALQINDQASLGAGFRLLGQQGFASTPVNTYSVCGEISYYQYTDLGGDDKKLEWGVKLGNIGPKLKLEGNPTNTFLPAMLGLGVSLSGGHTGSDHQWTLAADITKSLVPAVADTSLSVLSAMGASFAGGIGKLVKTVRVAAGIEYGFASEFFLRSGISLEHASNGNRKFAGMGVGYKGLVLDQSWSIDFHYLQPFAVVAAVSPFDRCFGFTLTINFGNFQ